MRFLLKLLILLIPNLAISQDSSSCPVPGLPTFGMSALGIAHDTTKSCSINDINANKTEPLMTMSEQEASAICDCLKPSIPWKEKNISPATRQNIEGNDVFLEKTFRFSLYQDFGDLVSTFYKFNNYMLTKDHLGNVIDDKEIEASGGLCNFDTIVQDIKALRETVGSPGCQVDQKKFVERTEDVFNEDFGTLDQLKDFIKERTKSRKNVIDDGSDYKPACVTNSQMLKLRSSTGASEFVFEKIIERRDFKDFRSLMNSTSKSVEGKIISDKESNIDSFTYNPIFNLAMRDPVFYEKIRNQLIENKKNKKSNEDIYQDADLNKSAYGSMNRRCNDFSKNLKTYLCSKELPSLHPTITGDQISYGLDRAIPDKKEREVAQSFYTYKYSCEAPKKTNKSSIGYEEDRTELRDYLESSVYMKSNTKDLTSGNDDASDFAKVFCKGPEQFDEVTDEDLSDLTSKFAVSKKSEGVDLYKLFSDPEVVATLGLNIDLTVKPISIESNNPDDIKNGTLPKINQVKWNKLSKQLLSSGLTPAEAKQLYVILEMQTNKKSAEFDDLKSKLVKTDAKLASLTPKDLKNIVEKKPISNPSTPLSPEQVSSIQDRYSAQLNDEKMQLNYTQDLLFNNRSVQDIKKEAVVYTQNNSTYDKNYGKAGGNSGAPSSVEWGNPSTIPSLPEKTVPNVASTNSAPTPASVTSTPKASSTPASNNYEAKTPIQNNFSTPSLSPSMSTSASNVASSFRESSPVSSPSRSPSSTPSKKYDDFDSSIPKEDPYVSKLKDDAAKMKDEINRMQNSINKRANVSTQNKTTTNTFNDNSGPSNFGRSNNFASNFANPANTASGDELSSEKKKENASMNDAKAAMGSTGGSKGAPSGGSQTAPGASDNAPGSISAPSTSGISGLKLNLPQGGRELTDKEKADADRKRLNLAVYEHPKVIPYAYIDYQGSVADVVVMLSLEGKQFKTIEMVSEVDKATQRNKDVFYLRTFDFIPEGEFADFSSEFQSKELREIAYKAYFSYPRNKSSIKASKKYASATKEISKKEISFSEYQKLKYDILTEDNIKDILDKFNKAMANAEIKE